MQHACAVPPWNFQWTDLLLTPNQTGSRHRNLKMMGGHFFTGNYRSKHSIAVEIKTYHLFPKVFTLIIAMLFGVYRAIELTLLASYPKLYDEYSIFMFVRVPVLDASCQTTSRDNTQALLSFTPSLQVNSSCLRHINTVFLKKNFGFLNDNSGAKNDLRSMLDVLSQHHHLIGLQQYAPSAFHLTGFDYTAFEDCCAREVVAYPEAEGGYNLKQKNIIDHKKTAEQAFAYRFLHVSDDVLGDQAFCHVAKSLMPPRVESLFQFLQEFTASVAAEATFLADTEQWADLARRISQSSWCMSSQRMDLGVDACQQVLLRRVDLPGAEDKGTSSLMKKRRVDREPE
ncbi:hypothetical protein BDZ89DRAFT_1051256 [Hymenopellis radicata]|nr:hypothetical protein BDZ89DRAFT_1051256 [Hymenopellis radicata]